MWGPDGYGAILLVNCDRDNVGCNAQDNCDQHVSCLQGERAGAAQSLGTQGSSSVPPPGSLPPGGALKVDRGGSEFTMRFFRTQSGYLIVVPSACGTHAGAPSILFLQERRGCWHCLSTYCVQGPSPRSFFNHPGG